MKRRQFLKHVAGVSGGFMLTLPLGSCNLFTSRKIKFGISTDIHQDIIHDAPKRLSLFLRAAEKRKVDFVIDLGDFCFPIPENRDFLNVWKGSPLKKYNVLGNHDMDTATKQEFMDFVGMRERYYSFDKGDFHFVVVDPNNIYADGEFKPYEHANFYRPSHERGYVDPQQLEWLKSDLAQTNKHCIIFSHQSFENSDGGCQNGPEVRAVLEKANREARFQKVVAAFSGHHHTDYAEEINQITYIQINSMSYQWVGNKYSAPERFSPEINEKRPSLKYTIPYEEPLFAMVTIHNGKVVVEGTQTTYIKPGPEELNIDPRLSSNAPIVPWVSDREVTFPVFELIKQMF